MNRSDLRVITQQTFRNDGEYWDPIIVAVVNYEGDENYFSQIWKSIINNIEKSGWGSWYKDTSSAGVLFKKGDLTMIVTVNEPLTIYNL